MTDEMGLFVGIAVTDADHILQFCLETKVAVAVDVITEGLGMTALNYAVAGQMDSAVVRDTAVAGESHVGIGLPELATRMDCRDWMAMLAELMDLQRAAAESESARAGVVAAVRGLRRLGHQTDWPTWWPRA